MERIGTPFKGELTSKEKRKYEKSGNIQHHNGRVCKNFDDLLQYSAGSAVCDENFFRELYDAVKKSGPGRSQILLSLIFDAAAIVFIFVIINMEMSRDQTFVFSGIPVFLFFGTTCRLIRDLIKVRRVLKLVDSREDIVSFSLTIDGACSFTDNSGDDTEVFRYIYSEPMLICVPKELYDTAEMGGRLIGAVVGTGKNRLFYAVNVV